MLVFKCDRCGSYFTYTAKSDYKSYYPNAIKKCVVHSDNSIPGIKKAEYHLCMECMKEFEDWIDEIRNKLVEYALDNIKKERERKK